MEFNAFKALLEVTDGNLASHIKSLEKEEYIEVKKQFVGKKPNTTYRVTEKGRKSFEAHLDALEKLLNIRP
jgi:DNA-binding PadR family transcriptional regulator